MFILSAYLVTEYQGHHPNLGHARLATMVAEDHRQARRTALDCAHLELHRHPARA